MLPIVIVQNDEFDPPGLLSDSLAERDIPAELVEVFQGAPIPDLGEVSGLVLLGGHMSAYEEQAYSFLVEEKELVRAAVREGVPVLGICLGCQIVADALGGQAYRVEPQEVGLIDINLTEAGSSDPGLAGVEGPFASWHHDSWDLPPGGTLLADSDLYPQAFRFGSALGVQFHPELTVGVLESWIRRDADALGEIGMNPNPFLSAMQASWPALRERADGLFGAWLAEAGRRF
jgi:GMP synthase-like glutamine amidotransferase